MVEQQQLITAGPSYGELTKLGSVAVESLTKWEK